MRSWVQPLDPCEKTWVRWCILVMLMLVNIWGMVANQPSLLGKFQASVSQNRMEWYLRLPCWLHTQVYTHMHIPHLSIGIFRIFRSLHINLSVTHHSHLYCNHPAKEIHLLPGDKIPRANQWVKSSKLVGLPLWSQPFCYPRVTRSCKASARPSISPQSRTRVGVLPFSFLLNWHFEFRLFEAEPTWCFLIVYYCFELWVGSTMILNLRPNLKLFQSAYFGKEL